MKKLIKYLKFKIKYPIMYWFNTRSMSGVCECGHNMFVHHHGIIANINYGYSPRSVSGILGQECEYNGFNGMTFPDEDGHVCKCNSYTDTNWVFKLNSNYRYYMDIKSLLKFAKNGFTNPNRRDIK